MNIETSTVKIEAVKLPDNAAARQASAADAAAKKTQVDQRARAQADADTVRAAAKQIDSFLKSAGRTLNIRVDDITGRMVVTVRDSSSGDVIRQIPSEEALKLAQSLGESSAALLDLTA